MEEFLGRQIEVALVSDDGERVVRDLLKIGIGPWKRFTIDPSNTSDQSYHGRPSAYAIRVYFAEHRGMTWEIIEPLWGQNIFSEHLQVSNAGFQHVAYDCNNAPFEERIAGFRTRGFQFVQGGNWTDRCRFAFFEPEHGRGLCLETIEFDNFSYPAPEKVYA